MEYCRVDMRSCSRRASLFLFSCLLIFILGFPTQGEDYSSEHWSFGSVAINWPEPAEQPNASLYVEGDVWFSCPTYFVAGKACELEGNCSFAVIGGGLANTISESRYASIGGGTGNVVSGWGATIAGGVANTANGSSATIGGGKQHTAIGWATTVAGGARNQAGGSAATVGGGRENKAVGLSVTVSGGRGNTASGSYSVIGGGSGNAASGALSSVGGGTNNIASGTSATIPGGTGNVASGSNSFALGREARAVNSGTFVWHDSSDTQFESTANNQFLIYAEGFVGVNTDTPSSTVTVAGPIESLSGGFVFPDGTTQTTAALNTASDGSLWSLGGNAGTTPTSDFLGTTDAVALELHVNGQRAFLLEPTLVSPNVVGGFIENSVQAGVVGATVSGGGNSNHGNTVLSSYGTVGGGSGNRAGATLSDSGINATVSGGLNNIASGSYATVGGGLTHLASGTQATVAGGHFNQATGSMSTVAGGSSNLATGEGSIVAGGINNIASGRYSFAAGSRARAGSDGVDDGLFDGVFVWSDYSTDEVPSGGLTPIPFPSNGDAGLYDFLAPNQFLVRATGGTLFASAIDSQGTVTAGVVLNSGATAWSNLCDRSIKENFTGVDGRDVLEKLKSVPIEEWNLIAQGPSIQHVGPTAQDFYEAFGLGSSDRYINSADIDGVALVSIQTLYKFYEEANARIVELEAATASQAIKIDDLCARLNQLERPVLEGSKEGE
ncbi:MAG: hypothetical protein E4H08_08280 [Candidatus Atribacteria bacterium]|nr:MAG: hypothetical protein E4H08_08280 [Candidatus Atribacteria bacterium]